jgi:GntR family transcriptional regulator/MocR family aminotransferase
MLAAEGFLVGRQGAPTRVAAGAAMERPAPPAVPARAEKQPVRADFRTGRPDLGRFPFQAWRKCLMRGVAGLSLRQYGYADCAGLPALRREISEWLTRGRGFAVDSDDIFVTAGATHALSLLADILGADGRKVLIEDPCHSGMRKALLRAGRAVEPVPADDRGIITDMLPEDAEVSAVYVTPSHQFPLGGILPAARRAALIRFARAHDSYIIEDDYDSEFRYTGAPAKPLCAMDAQRVVYVGTFSKTVFPALRVGFAILPRGLQEAWRARRMYMDVQNPPFEQAALAEFLAGRGLDRHVCKMRALYGKRRQTLLAALAESFGEDFSVCGDAAGLHVAVDFPGARFDEAFVRRCAEAGILVAPLEAHCIEKGWRQSALVLGYGHLDEEAIRSGIPLLARVIECCRKTSLP